MTMFASPISASDKAACARSPFGPGWRRRDLWWERLQERANRDWEEGARSRALNRFLVARWLALALLPHDDPRQATSLANAAFAARVRGAEKTAARRYARALRRWEGVSGTINSLDFAPSARSSLFHLRMELRHRGAYEANRRLRLARFVAEAGEALAALADGRPCPGSLFPRWKGMKPPVTDDSRKLLAACLLIRS